MIQFSINLKGKLREKAVLKTLQVNQRFDLESDKNGMVHVLVPCQLFEDEACRKDSIGNVLEQKNYTVKISKKDLDIINAIYYKGLMTHSDIKKGIKV